ncbi:hypothetical protein HYS31_07280 [Candidatus Woesearchaeota archaeon]|nr:hypothetical protein [Candidatus Woesearchaeota archaeon]
MLNRREFLALSAGGLYRLLAAPEQKDDANSKIIPNSKDIVRKYRVPDSVIPVNIEQIARQLADNQYSRVRNYVPDFINLVQNVHYELTGRTYRQHMEEKFRNPNPIIIALVDEPASWDARKFVGLFVHDDMPRHANIAYISSDLGPAQLLRQLNHEMTHAVYGVGELRAIAHTHRDISYAIASWPRLLQFSDEFCPLHDLISYYIYILNKKVAGAYSNALSFLYMVQMKDGIEQVVENLTDPDMSDFHRGFALQWSMQEVKILGTSFERMLLKSLVEKTEDYILHTGAGIPKDKQSLLKRKTDKLKAEIGNLGSPKLAQ